MRHFLSYVGLTVIIAQLLVPYTEALSVTSVISGPSISTNTVDILSEGITAQNAGRILSKTVLTDGKFNISEKKFQIFP